MNSISYKSGNYLINKDGFVSLEGDKTESMDLLLKGQLDVYISTSKNGFPAAFDDLKQKSYMLFSLDQSIFIGVNDLLKSGINSLTITAATDCSLYAYPAKNARNMLDTIHKQKDYGTYVINSICNFINRSYLALLKASSYCKTLKSIYLNLSAYYAALAEEYGFEPVPGIISTEGASELDKRRKSDSPVPVYFSRQFAESEVPDASGVLFEDAGIMQKIEYYIHMLQIPADAKKPYFAADRYITEHHISDASECLDQILLKLRDAFGSLEGIIGQLYGENDKNAYMAFLKAANDMKAAGLDHTPALDAISYLYDKLNEIAGYIDSEYRHNIGIDFKYFEYFHMNTVSSLAAPERVTDSSTLTVKEDHAGNLPEELIGSAAKILEYSGIPEEKATCFMMNLTAFRNLRDRLSTDESARTIRNAITELYFEIYSAVFRKAYLANDNSRLIRMFLSYGFMDEKLLSYDQTMAIYKLAGLETHMTGIANVYYMHEWFAKIYSMEKDPSINNFGYDYYDMFRELKKQGKLSDRDKAAYENDRERRFEYEINNMFKQNHKLCHGQIAYYFPILHKDMAPHNPIRSHVSPAVICEKLNKILEIDFSAFHREINYFDPNSGIEKEIVMMQVIPDFLLVPVYGTRAMMWQEITGRYRNSPGRLILPVFTDENLDDMLVKLVGNFRWDLCRLMMGSAWNNIAHKSLTSEYSDYIQFYRKNRDLSEDAKEKIKAQIARYHSKLRDIFTSDYEIWVNYESKGNPRLNRYVRNILFRYCPFSKEILGQLEKQPIYSELVTRMKHQRAKQVRELENRYKRYIKPDGTLDPVLAKNLEFYRDL